MSKIKCRLIREERLFKDVYTAEIKVIDGFLPQTVGVIKKIQYKDDLFQIPIRYVETCMNKGTYRLFFHNSTGRENDYLLLMGDFQNQLIELEVSDYSLFQLQSNPKKVLLFIDELAIFESLAIIHSLSLNKIETYLYIKTDRKQEETISYLQHLLPNRIKCVSSFSYQEVSPILDKQVMGTKLFISGMWPMIRKVKEIAYAAGFTDEEIQYKGIGRKNEKIFCVKCYNLNRKKNEYETTCENCNTILDVSTHFSRRLDAYLGYIKIV
ncbi:hypothetical protein PB1_03805 [Bacillus methanolicus PB1]|uniref:Dimethylamine monooxygenase subunit DmmA-like C-terminal domain-containing protein n=1 Tax=Bacillus methanolicus PB1 TaxID=997296 RepID=I3E6B1_BACMT|nr:dimethylamine monooxygenase subunit DmmA family protein [Bacillus methanolicus]EIJ82032.1 hypothetical protein PB1_03805 [Bacillus methanolicus PB1]